MMIKDITETTKELISETRIWSTQIIITTITTVDALRSKRLGRKSSTYNHHCHPISTKFRPSSLWKVWAFKLKGIRFPIDMYPIAWSHFGFNIRKWTKWKCMSCISTKSKCDMEHINRQPCSVTLYYLIGVSSLQSTNIKVNLDDTKHTTPDQSWMMLWT